MQKPNAPSNADDNDNRGIEHTHEHLDNFPRTMRYLQHLQIKTDTIRIRTGLEPRHTVNVSDIAFFVSNQPLSVYIFWYI